MTEYKGYEIGVYKPEGTGTYVLSGVYATTVVNTAGDQVVQFWAEGVEEAKREIDCLTNPFAMRRALVVERALVGEGFCLICGRATDHRAEHSMLQLLAAWTPEMGD